MIYIVGMSHAINVLRAISDSIVSLSNENWSQFISDGKFFELKTKKEIENRFISAECDELFNEII